MGPMLKRNQVMGYLICVSLLGFLLRVLQLKYAFDEQGLMVGGNGSVTVLAVLSAIVVLVVALFCRELESRPIYIEAFSDGILELLLTMTGAIFLLLGSAIQIARKDMVEGALGVVAALCMAGVGTGRFRDRPAPLTMHIYPFLYLVCKLIIDFKRWSIDPAILDYCFSLLAMICAMCATYHINGFCFDKGRRRITVFWCLCGVFFCGVTLADGGVDNWLVNGGLGIWLFVNAWQLLETPQTA